MKNFRKVLALVLVVATLFSFASMASAAKVDYKDAEAFNYADAVEVLSAIGILNGYAVGDGYEFRPGDPIDRDETAKMIAVLANAGDDVSTLYAGANTFADVANTHWAASYIAYCVQTGIVAGRNASTFDPDASVTGFEVAKMLLCVMGFDAQTQGYIGANWKVNVLRDAKNFGLLDNLNSKFDMSKAATREEVAQMMLNVLGAPVVIGTISDETIKISNSLYMNLSDNGLEKLYWELKDANMNEDYAVVYGNVIVAVNTLVGDMYKGLNSVEAIDKFGRPGVAWTYENAKGHEDFVKFYAYPSDHYYTQRATLNVDLSQEINSRWPYQIVLFVDGKLETLPDDSIGAGSSNPDDGDVSTYGTTKWDEDKGKWVLTDAFEKAMDEFTGKGVETFVYVDDVHRQIVVSVVNTYIDEVVAPGRNTKKSKKFDLSEYTGLKMSEFGVYKDGDVVLYRVGDKEDFRELPAAKDETTYDKTVSRIDYTKAKPAYAKAVAAVTEAECEIVRVKTLSGPTKGDQDVDKYTVKGYDGTTYAYAHNFNKVAYGKKLVANKTVFDKVNLWKNSNKEYAVYLDAFGNIMFWDDAKYDFEWDVAYFVENGWKIKYTGESTYEDHGYIYFNKYVDFNGNGDYLEMDFDFFKVVGPKNENTNGTLAYYRYDEENEEYVSVLAETGSMDTINTKNGQVDTGVDTNSDTVFMVRTFNYAECEYEYEIFEGYKALRKAYPGEINVGKSPKAAKVQYLYAFDEDDASGFDEELAAYVFIDAAYAIAPDQSFFVLGYVNTVNECDLIPETDEGYLVEAYGEYDVYKALVGGEVSYVLVNNRDKLDMGKYEKFMQALGVTAEDGLPLYLVSDKNESFELVQEGVLDTVEEIKGDLIKATYKGAPVRGHLADDAEIVVVATKWNSLKKEYEYNAVETFDNADEVNDYLNYEMDKIDKAYVEFSDDVDDVEAAFDEELITRLILLVH